MAAGLGFKDFVTGEVLTAADVDGYLMQGVWVFASAAARDAAVTSPQEGNFAYLKDTNVTTYYTGSAWANLDTTGMTNPMTTTGDTIYSSSGSTPARLGIGSTGQVLTVAGGVPSWATSSSGGMTSIATGTLSGASVSITSIPSTYNQLFLQIGNPYITSGSAVFQMTFNSNTTANSYSMFNGTSAYDDANVFRLNTTTNMISYATTDYAGFTMNISNYSATNANKIGNFVFSNGVLGDRAAGAFGWSAGNTTAISSLQIKTSASTFAGGTYTLWGVK